MSDIDLSVLETTPICAWDYPRILVGIPLERTVSYADKVFFPFMQIAAQGPAMIESQYGRIDVVRNVMATQLLTSTYTHLLMLDIDHIHPSDIIQRLARWTLIFPQLDVVSGLNFRRKKPFDPVAGTYSAVDSYDRPMLTQWPKGLVRVDEVGGASLLVHRRVFERLEPPWFFNIYDHVWENNYPGEDIGFSRKCKQAGIDIYIDTTTSSPHCTEATVTEETFRAYLKEYGNESSM